MYFINCSFSSTDVLSDFYGKKVGFIICSLSYDILEKLLCSAAHYNYYDVLDLTGNELGKDPDLFVKILRHTNVMGKRAKELILMDNGFDENIISLLREKTGNAFEKIYI